MKYGATAGTSILTTWTLRMMVSGRLWGEWWVIGGLSYGESAKTVGLQIPKTFELFDGAAFHEDQNGGSMEYYVRMLHVQRKLLTLLCQFPTLIPTCHSFLL
jgi:hypothetical protein